MRFLRIVAIAFVVGCGAGGYDDDDAVMDSSMSNVENWVALYPELVTDVKLAFEDDCFIYEEYWEIQEKFKTLQSSKSSEKWSKWAFRLKEPKVSSFELQTKIRTLTDINSETRVTIRELEAQVVEREAEIKQIREQIGEEHIIPDKALAAADRAEREYYDDDPEYYLNTPGHYSSPKAKEILRKAKEAGGYVSPEASAYQKE